MDSNVLNAIITVSGSILAYCLYMQVKSTKGQKLFLVITSMILFIFSILFISNSNLAGLLYGNIGLIFIFFIIGYGLGKYLPKVSWIIGILPTILWFIYWWSRTNMGGWAMVIGYIGLIWFIFALIGIRFGVWAAKEKDAKAKIILKQSGTI